MSRLFYSRYWPTVQRFLPVLIVMLYSGAVFFVARTMSTISDQRIRFVLACVGFHTTILLLLTVGLITGKFIAVQQGKRRNYRLNRIGDLLAAYSPGTMCERELIHEARKYPDEFLQVWEKSLENLKGGPRRLIEELLKRTGLDERLLAQLRDPNPGKVLRAIALLRKCEDPQVKTIEEALEHHSEAVQASARITLASRGSSSVQRRVLSRLPHLPFWQRVVIYQQIPSESPVLQDHLARVFQSKDDTAILAALEFILNCQRVQSFSVARRLANSSNVEIRIKFFKALPLLAIYEDAVTLIQLGLGDADWRVRAMAARACGVLGISQLGPELAEKLAHVTHPVEAGHLARALAALGGESWQRLQEFKVSDNNMTRAIAAEVIEKHLIQRTEQLT